MNILPREWKTFLSPRFGILAVLLLVLCVLAARQLRWIDRVAQAERDRAKRNLTTSVSNFERDFDIEITRVLATFQFPASNSSEYSDRYKAWLRLSPYPDMIRGVYILDTRKTDSPALKAVLPGEPPIRSSDWERELPNLARPLHLAATSSPPAAANGLKVMVRGRWTGAVGLFGPSIFVDGNPAFAFPIMPTPPARELRTISQTGDSLNQLQGAIGARVIATALPAQWAVIVLDASVLESKLLPALLKTYFPDTDYDVLVVENSPPAGNRIVYRSPSAPPQDRFVRADGVTPLFLPRLDCFASMLPDTNVAFAQTGSLPPEAPPGSPVIYATGMGVVSSASEGSAISVEDRLSDILSRRPTSCDDSPLPLRQSSVIPWELLVRYHSGSLDQAMVIFRRRNLLWSVGVLCLLAGGMCMMVVLSERARSFAKMQSEFVLGVSHELRTPLTVIYVAADNLRKGLVEDAEQARHYGEIITSRASELSNMIEETLVLARVQSGPLLRNRTCVSPEEIVQSALANCACALQDAGIAVELRISPQLPFIEADAGLLERCLRNLIQNVVKYAATGKRMAVGADKVVRRDMEWVQFSVQDCGPGISSADLSHIFEPFYRGKLAQTPSVSGLGLGLTLVKRVVYAHLGEIEVKSSEQGTAFLIFMRPYEERKLGRPYGREPATTTR